MRIAVTHSRLGFTLVELILAMIISSLLIAAIMTQADATIKSTRITVDRQNEQITQNAFFNLLKDHFEGLPGNCRMELTSTDSGKQFLSDMTFQNVPAAFNWGGVAISAKAMRMSTLSLRDGSLDVVLKYYEDDILDTEESVEDGEMEPIAEITLLKNVQICEWQVLDGRSSEWDFVWDISGRLPTQVELQIMFEPGGDIIRRVFWIPSRSNPTTEVRRLQSAGQQNTNPGNIDPGNGSGGNLNRGGAGR